MSAATVQRLSNETDCVVLWQDEKTDYVDKELWSRFCVTVKNALSDVSLNDDDNNDLHGTVLPLPNISRETGLQIDSYLRLLVEKLGERAGKTEIQPDSLMQHWDYFSNVIGKYNKQCDGESRPVFRFEMEFLKSLHSDASVLALANAANYLDCDWLIDATAEYVSNMAARAMYESVVNLEGPQDGQPPSRRRCLRAQILALRSALNIQSDFTKNEEETMLYDEEWKYDNLTPVL